MKNSKTRVFFFIYFASCILFLVSVKTADAAYKIYLKNGSIISGVSHYEKSGGEIRFYKGGGELGIPESQILKIETTDEPVKDDSSGETVRPPEPENNQKPEENTQPKPAEPQKPAEEKEKNTDEILQKEAELKKVEEELNRTKIGMQNLNNKALAGTITPSERIMFKQSSFKKRKLEEDKKRLEEELKKLKGQ